MTTMPILSAVHSQHTRDTFFPTPQALADKLLEGINFRFVHSVLEPSAGKGDLAMAFVQKRRWYSDDQEAVKSFDVDCIEIDPTLRQTLEGQGFRVVHDDFLTFETQKRYDLILMNPPFDQGAEHLLKALELMERGGKVRCLLNAETLRNPYSESRRQLAKKLAEYGADIQYKANAFSSAERRTDVEIAVVSVDIPAIELDSTIMEDMRKAPTYKAQEIAPEYAEIVRHNGIDAWVNRYNFEVACGIRLIEEHRAMQKCMPEETGLEGNLLTLNVHVTGGSDQTATINEYIRQVRGKYWRVIFQQPAFTSKLTYNLLQELYDNVRQLMDYDFSAYNILTLLIKMNQKVVGGIEQTILNLFDDWTAKYHWSETTSNRHYFDGWKTNDCFAVGKKVIVPFYGSYDCWHNISHFYAHTVVQKFSDIEKIFDFLDSGRTEWEGTVRDAFDQAEKTQNTKNIDTKYFTVTFFKKGTAHFVFKDMELLEKFNLFAAKHKNWLPPCYGKKAYQDMTKEEQSVVDSFQGKERYEYVMQHADYFLASASETLPLLTAG